MSTLMVYSVVRNAGMVTLDIPHQSDVVGRFLNECQTAWVSSEGTTVESLEGVQLTPSYDRIYVRGCGRICRSVIDGDACLGRPNVQPYVDKVRRTLDELLTAVASTYYRGRKLRIVAQPDGSYIAKVGSAKRRKKQDCLVDEGEEI